MTNHLDPETIKAIHRLCDLAESLTDPKDEQGRRAIAAIRAQFPLKREA